MQQALDGVRILDLTRVVVGPVATMLLADLGADVIKVEPPAGDDARYLQPGADPETCPFFMAINRNKRGIVLDIGKPEGRAVLHRLVRDADVLVQNFRPGIAERLGIGVADAQAIRPDIIYCAISTFGQTGPYAKRPGTDFLSQAMSGLMAITGAPDGPPMRAGAPAVDVTTGVSAALAIMAALMRRTRTGQGEVIDCSLLHQAMFIQAPLYSWAQQTGQVPPRLGNQSLQTMTLEFEADDGWLVVSIPAAKFWRALCAATGRPELGRDPRFASNGLRMDHSDLARRELGPIFLTQPVAAWIERLVAEDVPCAPVLNAQQVIADPQVRHLDLFHHFHHELAGAQAALKPPFVFASGPALLRRPPPRIGGDTTDVLREAGYDAGEIAALQRAGITVPAPLAPE